MGKAAGTVMCALGIHNWRDCKRAVWPLEYVKMTLELRACASCGVLHKSSQEQLDDLRPYQDRAPVIESLLLHHHGQHRGRW